MATTQMANYTRKRSRNLQRTRERRWLCFLPTCRRQRRLDGHGNAPSGGSLPQQEGLHRRHLRKAGTGSSQWRSVAYRECDRRRRSGCGRASFTGDSQERHAIRYPLLLGGLFSGWIDRLQQERAPCPTKRAEAASRRPWFGGARSRQRTTNNIKTPNRK
jgi:hypothetical protein